MNKLFFSLLFLSTGLTAQINQTWLHDRQYSFSFNDSYMRIVNNNIYTHTTLFEGSSWQSAQSITTDGVENWYMEHDQFQACANCGLAGVEAVAIASNGDAYGVGFQPSFPYGGRYVYKTDSAGNLVYAEEFFTSTFSGEFNDVQLSDDESQLYVFGKMYAAEYETIVPYLFKIDAATGTITDQVLIAPLGGAATNRITRTEGDILYMNSSGIDTLRFCSFDQDLVLRWSDQLIFPGYESSTQIRPQIYSNGDILFATTLFDYTNTQPDAIHLARYSSTGTLIWQQTHSLEQPLEYSYLYRDVAFGESGELFLYYVRLFSTGSGGHPLNDPLEINRGGKGGQLQFRPEVFKFNSDGQFVWNYVYEGSSGEEFSSEYANRIIVDENGYLIATSSGNSDGYRGTSVYILTPDGELLDSIFQQEPIYGQVNGMVYGGNQVFYLHGIGSDEEFSNNQLWVVRRLNYDYTIGFQDVVKPSQPIVYPNPSHDNFFVSIPEHESISKIELLDVFGRLVRKFDTHHSSTVYCEISDLASGVYFVKVDEKTARLIIN